jgi:hypothetical protein
LNAKIYKQDNTAVVEIHSVDGDSVGENILVSIDRNGLVSLVGEKEEIVSHETEPDIEEKAKTKKKRKPKPKDKPTVVESNGIKWVLVEPGDVEELKQRKGDEKIYGAVNTKIYCYKMDCPRCGSERYCKPQDIKQVLMCRACTLDDRKLRHANRQRERRKNNKKVVNGK